MRRNPGSSASSTIAIVGAVALAVGILYLVLVPRDPERTTEDADYEDLAPCAFLTSLDSTRSLYLAKSHVARLSTAGGNGLEAQRGTWTLIDDERHTYKITIEGHETIYTLVSAPEGEGCMLVTGDPKAADLTSSWFSTLQDPK